MDPIQIESRDVPGPARKPFHAPPDYRSWSTRVRLYALIAALLLVVVAMNEARKPERWRWITGNENRSGGVHEVDDQELLAKPDANDGASPAASRPMDREAKVLSGDEVQVDASSIQEGAAIARRDKIRPEQEFWRSIFLDLDRKEQILLFRLLRDQETGSIYSESDQGLMLAMLQHVDELVQKQLLTEIERAKGQAEEALVVAATDAVLVASRKWSTGIMPYLKSTVEKELKMFEFDVRELKFWRANFEQAMMGLVSDETNVLALREGPAWLVLWDRILRDSAGKYRPVTTSDLLAQPEVYRAQPVEFDGRLRLIEKFNMVENAIGIDTYYVLWIVGPDSDTTPICVYTIELPPGTEPINQPTTVVNWSVKIRGYFLKTRTYVNRKTDIRSCPLVLARSCISMPTEVAEDEKPRVVIPPWFLLTILGIFAVAAIAIARTVYQSTKVRRYHPGPNRLSTIHQNLESLSDNPTIKSNRERVAELDET